MPECAPRVIHAVVIQGGSAQDALGSDIPRSLDLPRGGQPIMQPVSIPKEPPQPARTHRIAAVRRLTCANALVGDTGIEPVTSSVSGKRSPAELIALHRSAGTSGTAFLRGGNGIRTRVHGFAGRCLASRPSHRDRRSVIRADDGIRTRDPHLGKVMRYQLRYVRLPHAHQGLRGPATVSEPAGANQTGRVATTFQR